MFNIIHSFKYVFISVRKCEKFNFKYIELWGFCVTNNCIWVKWQYDVENNETFNKLMNYYYFLNFSEMCHKIMFKNNKQTYLITFEIFYIEYYKIMYQLAKCILYVIRRILSLKILSYTVFFECLMWIFKPLWDFISCM